MVKIKYVYNEPLGKYIIVDVPLELYYSVVHTYAQIMPDNRIKVGLDDYFQKVLGKLRRPVQYLPVGTFVKQHESFGSVIGAKARQTLYSPVSGEIVEINEKLNENWKLLNEDPYGEGWLVILEPTENLEEELKKLHTGKALEEWIKEECKLYLKRKMMMI
jgi:glycine cleavage system H protein